MYIDLRFTSLDELKEFVINYSELLAAPGNQVISIGISERAPAEAPVAGSEAPAPLTRDQAMDLLRAYKNKHGVDVLKAKLESVFGVKRVNEIQESDFEKVRTLCAE